MHIKHNIKHILAKEFKFHTAIKRIFRNDINQHQAQRLLINTSQTGISAYKVRQIPAYQGICLI